MENKQSELELETERLAQTIAIAENQLNQARQSNEQNLEEIIAAKKELRENTSHSIASFWSSDGFEALAELSQYANPVTDKIVNYEEVENKILLLENLVKSPYFARINFKFQGENDYEKIYIGRCSLKKDNSYDMEIYDWRSPIASVFYRFVTGNVFYDAPGGRMLGEVNLKRQYEISGGRLEYFFDADVQIVDEFLRKLLSQNTSSKMKSIVETIQREQDIVIRDMENDLMMVQGVAGSGKTSIALHRAAYLMYQGLQTKLSANNILIISPNSLFEQYISNVLPELGENNVVSVVFEEILASLLQKNHLQSRNQFLEKLINSDKNRRVIKDSMELKTSPAFITLLNQFISDLPHKWIAFEDVYYAGRLIVKKEMLKEKISGRIETPIGVKLKQLEDYIFEIIKALKKGHLPKSEATAVKEEIRKFTELNILELYKKLFSDKNYLKSLLPNPSSYEDWEAVADFTMGNLNNGLLSYDDATVLAYMHLRLYGNSHYKNIKQVVIDEAQDYYPLQYEIFHLLFPNSKFTVLGDMNQTLEKQEDISLYGQISKILDKKKSSLITMDKSFRCTNEILNFSMKFIKQSPEIKSFNRSGEEPEIHVAPHQESLNQMLLAEVDRCLKKGCKSIGLICKTEKNSFALFQSLRDLTEVSLIKNGSAADLQGVFIIPVCMSKGLEFDAVLICDADRFHYNSEDDKKLLYIACTRALHRLNLFCIGAASVLTC